jgi:aryl-alcohol dehydrogenase-like predicted oxidoreductase
MWPSMSEPSVKPPNGDWAVDVKDPKERRRIQNRTLRWLKHHSMLKQELGDAVIVGASSVKHLEDNLLDLEKEG